MNERKERQRLLICDPIAQVGIDMLHEHFAVDLKTSLNPNELLKIIHKYDAVVVRSATQITSALIERAPCLRVIGRAGAGLDNIAVDAAERKGIKVVNSPDANSVAVAELTMSMILALARHLSRADKDLKNGKWEKNKLMGIGLAGKTIGIIGFGRIGKLVALRANAFGMRVLVFQRNPKSDSAAQFNVQQANMAELYRESDFITLHVPKSPQTNGLVGKSEFALMKPSAYLINTSRGTVVDEMALLKALDNGTIAGAGLDVYAKEPATDSVLVRHPKVLATPHIAASTEDAQNAAAITIAQKIIDILLQQTPQKNPLSLRVVELGKVIKHENVDPKRVDKLKKRLKDAVVFANPPLVVEDSGQYIVLDGATRTTAIEEMGFKHMIVQVFDKLDELELDTWCHAIRKVNSEKIIDLFKQLPGIILSKSQTGKVLEEMLDHGGLCYLSTVDGKVYYIQATSEVNHLDALNKLTNSYIEKTYVSRSTDNDIKTLLGEYPDLAALVVFPKYEIEQVLQIARSKRLLPAGITRFLIPGRVMRINADLTYLKSDRSLAEKNEWLYALTMEKLADDQVRYYQEPVYLMDE